jgi:hypothetical protein
MLGNLFERATIRAAKIHRVTPNKVSDGTDRDNGADNPRRWNWQEAGTDRGSENPNDEADSIYGVAPGTREQEVANALGGPYVWEHGVTTLRTGWHVNWPLDSCTWTPNEY